MESTHLYHLLLAILMCISVGIVIFYRSYIRYCSPLSSFWMRFQLLPISVMVLLWVGIIARYLWLSRQPSPNQETNPDTDLETQQSRYIWEQVSFYLLFFGMVFTCVWMFSQLGKFVVASQEGVRVGHTSLWDGFRNIPSIFSTCEPLRRKSMEISSHIVPISQPHLTSDRSAKYLVSPNPNPSGIIQPHH